MCKSSYLHSVLLIHVSCLMQNHLFIQSSSSIIRARVKDRQPFTPGWLINLNGVLDVGGRRRTWRELTQTCGKHEISTYKEPRTWDFLAMRRQCQPMQNYVWPITVFLGRMSYSNLEIQQTIIITVIYMIKNWKQNHSDRVLFVFLWPQIISLVFKLFNRNWPRWKPEHNYTAIK